MGEVMQALAGPGQPPGRQPAPRREARRRITVTPRRFHCADDCRRANASATMNRELRRLADRAVRRRSVARRRSSAGSRRRGDHPTGAQRRAGSGSCRSVYRHRRRTVVDSTDPRWPPRSGPATERSSRTAPPACSGASRGCEGARIELWVPSPRHPRVTNRSSCTAARGSIAPTARRSARSRSPLRSARSSTSRSVGGRPPARRDGERLPAEARVRPSASRRARRAPRSRADPAPDGSARSSSARGDGRPLESALEGKVWLLLQRTGLPLPAAPALGARLPGGRYRLDFAWPERKLGLECDGWEHHGRRSAFGKDRARLPSWSPTGWRVLPRHLGRRHARAATRRALGARWRSPP